MAYPARKIDRFNYEDESAPLPRLASAGGFNSEPPGPPESKGTVSFRTPPLAIKVARVFNAMTLAVLLLTAQQAASKGNARLVDAQHTPQKLPTQEQLEKRNKWVDDLLKELDGDKKPEYKPAPIPRGNKIPA